MKKSEIYKLAQLAVVTNFSPVKDEQKLEVLRVLMEQEDVAVFVEKQEAKKNQLDAEGTKC